VPRRLVSPLAFAVLLAVLLATVSIPHLEAPDRDPAALTAAAGAARHAPPGALPGTRAGRRAAGPLAHVRAVELGWRDRDHGAGEVAEDLERVAPPVPLVLRAKPAGGVAVPAVAAVPPRAPGAAPGRTDRAAPWSADRLAADATGMNDQHLALACDPATDHLFAAFEAYDLGGTDRDIHLARSTDGGQTWSVVELPSSQEDEFQPDLALDAAGYLHVVWARADGALVRARSAAPGDINNWALVRIFEVGEPVAVPSIAVSGSGDFARVFIACSWYTANHDWWQYEYTLLWLFSTNGSQTVGYDYLLPDGYQDLWPDAALSGATAYLVNGEQDPYTGRVRILAAADAVTGTFVDYVDLTQTTPMSTGFPAVVADGETVHLAYQLDWDDGLGNIDGDVMYCVSWDGLATVYGPYEMIATPTESVGPVLFTRGGNVGCLWLEAPAGGDEFHLAGRLGSLDGHPDGWGGQETVTDLPLVVPQFRSAAGALAGDRVLAAWVDRRNFNASGWDVFAADRAVLPDLAPYTPADWESPLVGAMVAGQREDGIVAAGFPAYASLAIANLGLAAATQPVVTELWLDGARVGAWTLAAGLPPATYSTAEDVRLDLPAGAHTLTLRVDPADLVAEADETDNELVKDLWVVSGEPDLELAPASLRFEAPAPALAAAGGPAGDAGLAGLPTRDQRRSPVVARRLAAALARAADGDRLRVVVRPASCPAPSALADLGRRGAIAALRDRAAAFARDVASRRDDRSAALRSLWLSGELVGELTATEVADLAADPAVGALWLDDVRSEFRAAAVAAPASPAPAGAPAATRGPAMAAAVRSPWPLEHLNVPAAWSSGLDGSGILVGHTDSGVAWDHPDLAGRLWDGGAEYPYHGYDFLDEDLDPYDPGEGGFWHGTHTAGLVVSSSYGAAPGARLLVTRCVPGYYEDMVEALQFCLDQGCHLISTSAGWTQAGDALRAANRANAEVLLAVGVPWLVAAGNGDNGGGHLPAPHDISSPGDCPDPWYATAGRTAVVTVGALTQMREVWSSSSRGPAGWGIAGDHGYDDYPYPPGLMKPDVAAPGAVVTSTVGGGGYASYSGTSMATPLVAGCAALLLQASPTLSPADLAGALQTTAADVAPAGRDDGSGAGLVDVPAAVAALPASQGASVQVRNTGAVPLVIASITEGAEWLDVVPAAGTVAPGDSLRLTVTWDAGGLEVGSYGADIVLQSNDPQGPAHLPVTLVVGQPVGVDDGPGAVPTASASLAAFPNPFNPRTALRCAVPVAGPVTLRLYDPRGRLVRTLVAGDLAAGVHEVVWDGLDRGGRPCAAGVYVARLQTRDGAATRKLLLAR